MLVVDWRTLEGSEENIALLTQGRAHEQVLTAPARAPGGRERLAPSTAPARARRPVPGVEHLEPLWRVPDPHDTAGFRQRVAEGPEVRLDVGHVQLVGPRLEVP